MFLKKLLTLSLATSLTSLAFCAEMPSDDIKVLCATQTDCKKYSKVEEILDNTYSVSFWIGGVLCTVTGFTTNGEAGKHIDEKTTVEDAIKRMVNLYAGLGTVASLAVAALSKLALVL